MPAAGTDHGGAVVTEYAAGTGRRLASQDGAPLKFSAAGASLAAVPADVWGTFRTGMMGQAALLRGRGLTVVALPSKDARIYSWAMGASTRYGGGSLWLSQSTTGRTACVAPATGRVRSSATLKALSCGGSLLAVGSSARLVYAIGRPGLVTISAPAACWR